MSKSVCVASGMHFCFANRQTIFGFAACQLSCHDTDN